MLVAAGVPAVCVVAWASTQPGLVDHLQTSATRERAGAWFALALVLGVAAALGLSHYARRAGERLSAEARRRWALRLGRSARRGRGRRRRRRHGRDRRARASGSTSSAARATSSRDRAGSAS